MPSSQPLSWTASHKQTLSAPADSGWERCPGVPAPYGGFELRYRGTEIDQCGRDNLSISSVRGPVPVERGDTASAEVAGPRFQWLCGGSREATTAKDGVNFVIAKRGLTDRQIIWDPYTITVRPPQPPPPPTGQSHIQRHNPRLRPSANRRGPIEGTGHSQFDRPFGEYPSGRAYRHFFLGRVRRLAFEQHSTRSYRRVRPTVARKCHGRAHYYQQQPRKPASNFAARLWAPWSVPTIIPLPDTPPADGVHLRFLASSSWAAKLRNSVKLRL